MENHKLFLVNAIKKDMCVCVYIICTYGLVGGGFSKMFEERLPGRRTHFDAYLFQWDGSTAVNLDGHSDFALYHGF